MVRFYAILLLFAKTSKTSWEMGKTPYERRFGEPFGGPIILFGTLIEYLQISPKYHTSVHQYRQESIARNLSWLVS